MRNGLVGWGILVILLLGGSETAATPQAVVIQKNIAPRAVERMVNRLGTVVCLGDTVIEQDNVIQGHLVTVGGNAFIIGTVQGDVMAIGGNVGLRGGARVEGSVRVFGGTIYSSRLAQVEGEQIVYRGSFQATVTADGKIQVSKPTSSFRKRLAWRFNPTIREYSRVNGAVVGLGFEVEPFGHRPYPHFSLRVYLPTQDRPSYLGFEGEYEQSFGDRDALVVGLEGYKKSDSNDRWRVGPLENGLATFFTRNDFWNYFERRGGQFKLVYKPRPSWKLGVGYSLDEYHNLVTRSPFTLFGHGRPQRPNPPIDEGRIGSVSWTLGYDSRPDPWISVNAWVSQLTIEWADPVLGNDFDSIYGDFNFVRFDLTLIRYQRLFRDHQLDFHLKWATSNHPLPLQRAYVLGAIGGLRGFGDMEYAGDRLLLFRVNYRFSTVNRVPILKRVLPQMNVVLFVDTGSAFFSTASGRNTMDHPALSNRISPHVPLPLPGRFSDLRSDAGLGFTFPTPLTTLGLYVAQNLHDRDVVPRVTVRLTRDF